MDVGGAMFHRRAYFGSAACLRWYTLFVFGCGKLAGKCFRDREKYPMASKWRAGRHNYTLKGFSKPQ
eukprot:2696044-Rhodomonas_salina.1